VEHDKKRSMEFIDHLCDDNVNSNHLNSSNLYAFETTTSTNSIAKSLFEAEQLKSQ
jgi:hypothetical protein